MSSKACEELKRRADRLAVLLQDVAPFVRYHVQAHPTREAQRLVHRMDAALTAARALWVEEAP